MIERIPDALNPDLYSFSLKDQSKLIKTMAAQIEEQKELIMKMSEQISIIAKSEITRREEANKEQKVLLSYKSLNAECKQKIVNVFCNYMKTKTKNPNLLWVNLSKLNLHNRNIDKMKLYNDIKEFTDISQLKDLLY